VREPELVLCKAKLKLAASSYLQIFVLLFEEAYCSFHSENIFGCKICSD